MLLKSIMVVASLIAALPMTIGSFFIFPLYIGERIMLSVLCLATIALDLFLLVGKREVHSIRTGSFKPVRETTFFKDEKSGREVGGTFWYPSGKQGKCPFIIASHGEIGTKDNGNTLYEELASHGYAVLSLDHPGQSYTATLRDGTKVPMDKEYSSSILKLKFSKEPEKALEEWRKWSEKRKEDAQFALEVLNRRARAHEKGISSLIDLKRVGILGHGIGGSALLALAKDRRDIKCAIALDSPFIWDVTDCKDGAFTFSDDEIGCPLLSIYSSTVWKKLGKAPIYGKNRKYLDSKRMDIKNVRMEKLGHLGLTDLYVMFPYISAILDGFSDRLKVKKAPRRIADECLSFVKDEMPERYMR